jgi:hypothetical protein
MYCFLKKLSLLNLKQNETMFLYDVTLDDNYEK